MNLDDTKAIDPNDQNSGGNLSDHSIDNPNNGHRSKTNDKHKSQAKE